MVQFVSSRLDSLDITPSETQWDRFSFRRKTLLCDGMREADVSIVDQVRVLTREFTQQGPFSVKNQICTTSTSLASVEENTTVKIALEVNK